MSRQSANPARQVLRAERKATDVLALHSRSAWAATRFALPRFHLNQMRYALRHRLMTEPSMRFFRMDGLEPAKREELFALLDRQGCTYEVWR